MAAINKQIFDSMTNEDKWKTYNELAEKYDKLISPCDEMERRMAVHKRGMEMVMHLMALNKLGDEAEGFTFIFDWQVREMCEAPIFVEYATNYWPRWLRNSCAQIIDSVLDIEDTKKMADKLQALKDALLKPNVEGIDIAVDKKETIYKLCRWFHDKQYNLKKKLICNKDVDAYPDPFAIKHPGDIFISMSGSIVPSLDKAIWEILRKVDSHSFGYLKGADRPLHLGAPTGKLDMLRSLIPIEFHRFCEFEINDRGPVLME